MNRREALKNFTLLLGVGLSVTPSAFINYGCQSKSTKKEEALFNETQERTVAEIADTILPDTDTPGAKKAGVGPFIVMMIADCYPEDIQKNFVKGIDGIQERAKRDYDKSFISMSAGERETLMRKIEKEVETQKGSHGPESDSVSPEFFRIVKDLTLLGYFTSEVGATQALNYIQVPGRYNGCLPLEKGQKAWAT